MFTMSVLPKKRLTILLTEAMASFTTSLIRLSLLRLRYLPVALPLLLAGCGGSGGSGSGGSGSAALPQDNRIMGGPFQVSEDASAAVEIGRLTAVNVPAGSQTWAITGGDTGSFFSIDNTGRLTTTTAFAAATEHDSRYALIVALTIGTATVRSNAIVRLTTRVSASETRRYRFPVQSGRIYNVRSEEFNCSSSSGADPVACCVLSVAPNQPAGSTVGSLDTPYQVAAWPGDTSDRRNIASLVVEVLAGTELAVTLTGNKYEIGGSIGGVNCDAYLPEISASVSLANAQVSRSLTGQDRSGVGGREVFPSVRLIQVGEHVILRDISRRGSGGLGRDAHIESFIYSTGPASIITDATFWWTATALGTQGNNLNGSAVDAYVHTLQTYDYMKDVLGINSYDNLGSPLHIVSRFNTDRDITASWHGNYVLVGSGSGRTAAADLEVVAHEWGHGISEQAVRGTLTYEAESGALSEAFSDWFGIAVSRHHGENNWLIADDTSALALRDLSDPPRFGDPDIYRGDNWIIISEPCDASNDRCGIHTNSGVGNKMFYLLAAGGTHNGTTVTGIGIETAIRIAYAAARDYWTRNTNYAQAREGMVQAAMQAYSAGVVSQVENAWSAVGVQ